MSYAPPVRRSLLAIAVLGTVAACGLITGVGDLTTSPESVSEGGIAPGIDGALPDADAPDAAAKPLDASDASQGCMALPVTANDSGALSAPRAGRPITLDGVLDEWACAPFTRLDRASAAVVLGDLPDASQTLAMEFSVAWEPAALFVAARVSNLALPSGDLKSLIFGNDSIELYLDADGVLAGQGGTNDHQYIIDHANRAERYRVTFPPMAPTTPLPGAFASAVKTIGGVTSYELRIDAVAALGLSSLASGSKLGFDVGFNDSDGTAQHPQLMWYRAPTCSCTMTCCCGRVPDMPYCNTQRFGFVTLTP